MTAGAIRFCVLRNKLSVRVKTGVLYCRYMTAGAIRFCVLRNKYISLFCISGLYVNSHVGFNFGGLVCVIGWSENFFSRSKKCSSKILTNTLKL